MMFEKEVEKKYLHDFVAKVPKQLVPSIVAHRGFHNFGDELTRPLENTLEAFTTAWSAGFNLVECDVTVSSDGIVVFGHDTTFERVAKPIEQIHLTRIEQQPLSQLKKLQLIDDSPLLLLEPVVETLKKQHNSKLVVEIKDSAEADIITDALWEHISKLENVAEKIPVIMSFKPTVVFKLQQKLLQHLPTIEKPLVLVLMQRSKTIVADTQYTHEREIGFELPVELDADDCVHTISNTFIQRGETRLDGVYMQFDARMLQPDSKVRKNIKLMCKKFVVGVFLGGADREFDKLSTIDSLVSAGISFVNTDVPKDTFF